MKKIKDCIIHLLGGYTKEEFSKSFQSGKQSYMEEICVIPADEWCKLVYDHIKHNMDKLKAEYDSGVVGRHEKKEKETEWEERRFLISTAMLPYISQAVVRVENWTIVKHSKQECVAMAVEYADYLIEELKNNK